MCWTKKNKIKNRSQNKKKRQKREKNAQKQPYFATTTLIVCAKRGQLSGSLVAHARLLLRIELLKTFSSVVYREAVFQIW